MLLPNIEQSGPSAEKLTRMVSRHGEESIEHIERVLEDDG